MKRLKVNIGLFIVVCLIGYACYFTGKGYDLLLENVPFIVNGTQHPGIEALQASIDGAPPVYLLEGDRMMTSAIGTTHVLIIEILDEEDKVIPGQTRSVNFKIEDLGEDMSMNVPAFYQKALRGQAEPPLGS